MSDETDQRASREQLERRRLTRLVDALPVFTGFVSPDGHLNQARPDMGPAFLWALPNFAYAEDSVTQIVDLCDRAAKGERIQIERPYLKTGNGSDPALSRGLLTLTPIPDDRGHIDEIAVSLIDCEGYGLIPLCALSKNRLGEANRRIDILLGLAQTVIEACSEQSSGDMDRDTLSGRLDTLGSVIDVISDPDLTHLPLETVVATALQAVPDSLRFRRLKLTTDGRAIPMDLVPIISLLLSELAMNAQTHGAWRTARNGLAQGRVSLQSEVLDSAMGRRLRLHWIEDGETTVPAVQSRGFGFTLAEQLWPQITGGQTHLLDAQDGLSWTFEVPVDESPS